jgi:uncharacterized protein DUF222/HNH endonuclease
VFATDQRVVDRSGVSGLRLALNALRSGLRSCREVDPASLEDAELERCFAELQESSAAHDALRLSWLAEIDRRKTWARDGHLSTTSWLRDRHRASGGIAASEVRTARALQEMPATKKALERGEVSHERAGMLARAHEADSRAFGSSEELLVAAAKTLPARELGVAISTWREAADAEAARADAEHAYRRRRFRIVPAFSGMVHVEGDLDQMTGETAMTALGAEVDHQIKTKDPSDDRTREQIAADAAGEIFRFYLDHKGRAVSGGERPHVSVIVDAASLGDPDPTSDATPAGAGGHQSLPWARPEATYTGRISIETARRLACDAGVSRIVMAGRSEPIDVGRTTPVVPAAIRRAVVARDRHCRFPGCDRLPPWCDAHHVVHWADGGRTAASNLVLLCRRHHRMVHEGRFGLSMVKNRPIFTRPDGTVIEDRGPP